jgi:hypothetical protein
MRLRKAGTYCTNGMYQWFSGMDCGCINKESLTRFLQTQGQPIPLGVASRAGLVPQLSSIHNSSTDRFQQGRSHSHYPGKLEKIPEWATCCRQVQLEIS